MAASTQIAGTPAAAFGRLDEVDAMAVSLQSPDAKAPGALGSIADARRLSIHWGRQICAWSIPGPSVLDAPALLAGPHAAFN
jgi:hypothetical protein